MLTITLDGVALALFAVAGAIKALDYRTTPLLAVLLGTITGVVVGMWLEVRVDVTSSDFPRYDRNLNAGAFGTESHSNVAANTVFHDAMLPSHVVLPVLP